MSDDKRISGGDDPRSVLREEDLAWLACVASAGDGLLVLAHEDGSPVTVETLRRCLALGVIEPMASREGIGFRRTQRARTFIDSARRGGKSDVEALRGLLDAPDSPLSLAKKGGHAGLQRKVQLGASTMMLLSAVGAAAYMVTLKLP